VLVKVYLLAREKLYGYEGGSSIKSAGVLKEIYGWPIRENPRVLRIKLRTSSQAAGGSTCKVNDREADLHAVLDAVLHEITLLTRLLRPADYNNKQGKLY